MGRTKRHIFSWEKWDGKIIAPKISIFSWKKWDGKTKTVTMDPEVLKILIGKNGMKSQVLHNFLIKKGSEEKKKLFWPKLIIGKNGMG